MNAILSSLKDTEPSNFASAVKEADGPEDIVALLYTQLVCKYIYHMHEKVVPMRNYRSFARGVDPVEQGELHTWFFSIQGHRWMYRLDPELFINPDISRDDLTAVLDAGSRDAFFRRLPLCPEHIDIFVRRSLPEFLVWMASRCDLKALRCPKDLEVFEGIRTTAWYRFEPMPSIMQHVLVNCAMHLFSNPSHSLKLRHVDVQFNATDVAREVARLTKPSMDKAYGVVLGPESMRYACAHTKAMDGVFARDSLAWWPYNRFPPFKPRRVLANITRTPPNFRSKPSTNKRSLPDTEKPLKRRLFDDTSSSESVAFFGADIGSRELKFMAGYVKDGALTIHSRKPGLFEKRGVRRATYVAYLSMGIFDDSEALEAFRECDGVHPCTLITAGIPPEASVFARLVPYLDKYIIWATVERDHLPTGHSFMLDRPKDRALSGENSGDPGYYTPAYMTTSDKESEALVALGATGFVSSKAQFYDLVHGEEALRLSAYVGWVVHLRSVKEEMGGGEYASKVLGVLVPNVLTEQEKVYVEYTARAMVVDLDIKNVLIFPEGVAEAFCHLAMRPIDDGIIVGIVAGGYTGDVSISRVRKGQYDSVPEFKTHMQATTMLGTSSSSALNDTLVNWILSKMSQDWLKKEYKRLKSLRMGGTRTIKDAEALIRRILIDQIEALKTSLESRYAPCILINGECPKHIVHNEVFRIYGGEWIATLPVHEYFHHLKECLRSSVDNAYDVLNQFYEQASGEDDDNLSLEIFFSGGVFQNVGAKLAHDILFDKVTSDGVKWGSKIKRSQVPVQMAVYGAGAIGVIAMMAHLWNKDDMRPPILQIRCIGDTAINMIVPTIDNMDRLSGSGFFWRVSWLSQGIDRGKYDLCPADQVQHIAVQPVNRKIVLVLLLHRIGNPVDESHDGVNKRNTMSKFLYSFNDVEEPEKTICAVQDHLVTLEEFGDDVAELGISGRIDPLRQVIRLTFTATDGTTCEREVLMWTSGSWPGDVFNWRLATKLARLVSSFDIPIDMLEQDYAAWYECLKNELPSTTLKGISVNILNHWAHLTQSCIDHAKDKCEELYETSGGRTYFPEWTCRETLNPKDNYEK